VFIAGRWLWLVVTVALLSVGAYVFGHLTQFDDSAERSAQVAELRGFQERMLTASLREAIGIWPEGSTRAIAEEAEQFAERHGFVCEDHHLPDERGDWSAVEDRSRRLALDEHKEPARYRDALDWAHRLIDSGG